MSIQLDILQNGHLCKQKASDQSAISHCIVTQKACHVLCQVQEREQQDTCYNAGTGKEVGDRHPKVNDNVLIGASATILGNISIGKGAQVAAGSLVLKNVPPRTMVAGSPAKEVGKVTGECQLQ